MIENEGSSEKRIVTIFDDIYNLPDCRDYFRAMYGAGFRTAHHAANAFRGVRDDLARTRDLESLNILDFASGYGIAAALMRHDLTLDDVLERYRDPEFDAATPGEVMARDREWYAAHRRAGNNDRFVGIDIADLALRYGVEAGVFDAAYAENLQAADPGEELRAWLAECDLVVECGSVAHMLPDALDRVLGAAAGRRPWVITAPIRGNDTAAAIKVMHDHGLLVEVLDMPPFRHRRFADAQEQARAIANAQARGHVTDGVESTGYFHAQLYLGRPEDEATAPRGRRVIPGSG
ncbi:hypothetical protein DQW77_14120 [Roseovarius sp. TE539]|uniref:hypothetical protein n=1 Tax=Roseovarius sp. TE539 TaxID=2249812 RepID=UPI000DE0147C|nr:hypothetical protein [Roseovarius sp. TE539]RBI70348.1 hypothetical protein DQW77_14120 [Roseovarius sp. TE539]